MQEALFALGLPGSVRPSGHRGTPTVTCITSDTSATLRMLRHPAHLAAGLAGTIPTRGDAERGTTPQSTAH